MAKYISPLSNSTYRRLFSAQVLSLTGTGLSSVALALLAYELAGASAGAVLGTALAIKMVAYVGIAPVIGGIAHRLPRKALLISLDATRAGVVLLFPFVDAVWQVYVLIFLLNAGSAAFTPTFQAVIPDVLPDEARYIRALSLSRLAYDVENLLSPLLAAVLLTVISFDALFSLNALGFIASGVLVLLTVLPRSAASDRPAGFWFNLSFGIRAYLATPRLCGLLACNLAAVTYSSGEPDGEQTGKVGHHRATQRQRQANQHAATQHRRTVRDSIEQAGQQKRRQHRTRSERRHGLCDIGAVPAQLTTHIHHGIDNHHGAGGGRRQIAGQQPTEPWRGQVGAYAEA